MRITKRVRPSKSLAPLFAAIVVVIGALAPAAWAVPVVSYSSTIVPVGTSVPVTVNVSGGDATGATDFRVETKVGTTFAPPIVDIDLVTGTIYASNNAGDTPHTNLSPTIAANSVQTNSGTVPATGNLATVYLNTSTLIPGGTFTIQLQDVNNNTALDTIIRDGAGISLNATLPGTTTFTVAIPEPATLASAVFGGLLLLGRRRSRPVTN